MATDLNAAILKDASGIRRGISGSTLTIGAAEHIYESKTTDTEVVCLSVVGVGRGISKSTDAHNLASRITAMAPHLKHVTMQGNVPTQVARATKEAVALRELNLAGIAHPLSTDTLTEILVNAPAVEKIAVRPRDGNTFIDVVSDPMVVPALKELIVYQSGPRAVPDELWDQDSLTDLHLRFCSPLLVKHIRYDSRTWEVVPGSYKVFDDTFASVSFRKK